jgi:adenylate cyclase
MGAVGFPLHLLLWLVVSLAVVAFEKSDRYVEVAVVTVVAVAVMVCALLIFGGGQIRLVEQWAAGDDIDREGALAATYTWARRVVTRWVAVIAVWAILLLVVVGAIAGRPDRG